MAVDRPSAVTTVELGDRAYPIHVIDGDLTGLGAVMADSFAPRSAVLVTNPVVGALYAEVARRSLERAGFQVSTLQVPDGEAFKTLDTWRALVEGLLGAGVDRGTPVVALGGGVTGDIAGFAAATTLRGLPLVQVPTTLLAMVDSSVGGKTGVNLAAGKNLVGAFHQPAMVYAALHTLRTLDDAELRSGLGEVVKHGLLGDPEIFRICEEQAAEVRARDPLCLGQLVTRSCRVKAAVVAQDEREAGLRVVLNLGHTVGHAIEATAGFGRLRHGECVSLGLLAEARWAAQRGATPAELPARLREVLAGLGLPVTAPRLDHHALLGAAGHDKKRSRGRLRTAVLEGIGAVRVESVDADAVQSMIRMIRMEE